MFNMRGYSLSLGTLHEVMAFFTLLLSHKKTPQAVFFGFHQPDLFYNSPFYPPHSPPSDTSFHSPLLLSFF